MISHSSRVVAMRFRISYLSPAPHELNHTFLKELRGRPVPFHFQYLEILILVFGRDRLADHIGRPDPEKKSWFSSAFGESAKKVAGLTLQASVGKKRFEVDTRV